jgi:hypothetical protein
MSSLNAFHQETNTCTSGTQVNRLRDLGLIPYDMNMESHLNILPCAYMPVYGSLSAC